MKDQYLDLKRLANYSCLAVPTLRDYIREGELPCYKLRGKILVLKSEFDEWIKSFRMEGDDLAQSVDQILKKLGKSNG